MIQAHELVKVTVNRTYRDNWVAGFNNTEAVYEFAYEYDNGAVTVEQLAIPLLSVSHDNIDKLGTIKDFLIKEFVEVETPAPFESMKTYIRKESQ